MAHAGTQPSDRERMVASPITLGPELLVFAALLLYFIVLLRTAWLGDDAFITLRALRNLVQGHGLVSNVGERALGFTHPLWALLLLVPLSFGSGAYATAMGVSLVVSSIVALLVARRAGNPIAGATAVLWLALSAAYVDFSTSGLENPLAHLLLALFGTALLGGRLSALRVRTWLLAALIVSNRHDHALLIAPALLGLLPWPSLSDVVTSRGRALRALLPALRAALLGFSPLLSWLAFCVVYYGFAFPNTAYAKLNTHLPAVELIKQGFVYLGDSLQRDPLTPAVIALGLFGAWRQRGLAARTLAAGVVLYLVYLLRIGGDFMAGRFLTAPFLVCVVVLATAVLPRLSLRELAPIALGSAALGLCFSANFERVERFDCKFEESGIANERYCYAAHTGLLVNLRVPKYKSEGRYKHGLAMRREKLKVAPAPNVGLTGIAAGPSVHVLDTLALTEPLLARIPYQAQGRTFRIGHFHRDAPAGYLETLASGRNEIKDACVHKYYDVLARVIRGPLFSGERWRAILELNLGVHDYLMEPGCRLGLR